MSTIKCKICNSTIKVPSGAAAVECPFCRATQSLQPEIEAPPLDEGKIPPKSSETADKDTAYFAGKAYMHSRSQRIENFEAAIAEFKKIIGWRDVDEQIRVCQEKIEEIKAKEEESRLKRQRQVECTQAQIQKRVRRIKIIACITIPAVCVIAAIVLILQMLILPAKKKQAFIETYGQAVYDRFGLVEEGAYIKLGTYEQDNLAANGKEKIEWVVLAVEDGRALVISKYALDYQPYHTVLESITWEQCSLRQWLNSEFIQAAFSAEEAAMISTVTVPADPIPELSTDPGNATQDKIFPLSVAEAEKYFRSDKDRLCIATEYAEQQSDFQHNVHGTCVWWLRTPAKRQDQVVEVGSSGSIIVYGSDVNYNRIAVRPAMWIDLDLSN